ncbi:hypothetical protein BASA81_000454 [Batrachochytrium salamandrivorans]|nr:hypothetical protein BASA81_000454 [Batrachochytrium salamandrivorans]
MIPLAFLLASLAASASTCSVFPRGWYRPGGEFTQGLPPSNSKYSYTLHPSFLSCDEVKRLNTYCVAQINQFRSGEYAFSNGQKDPTLGLLTPYLEAIDATQCQAEINLGDFKLMGTKCGDGAHQNAFACTETMQGNQAQNTCCPLEVDPTFESVMGALDSCLQVMFDEGAATSGERGHYQVMKSPDYKYGVCAFTFATSQSSGRPVVLINQNFATEYAGQVGTLQPTSQPTTSAPTLQPTRKPTTVPVCGNGVVDAGEDCDCGDKCEEDACCNAQTCQYAAQAACSAQDGCCDTSTCSVKAKGVVCYAAANGCDVEEVCDGVSSACPEDIQLKVGETCGGEGGQAGYCSPCGTCVPHFSNQCSNSRSDWYKSCSWYPQDGMCRDMWCERTGDAGGCVGTVPTLFATKCGDGKSCNAEGACVANRDLVCPPTSPPTPSLYKPPPEATLQPTTNAPSCSPTGTLSPKSSLVPTLVPTKRPTGLTLRPRSGQPTSTAPTKPTARMLTRKPTTILSSPGEPRPGSGDAVPSSAKPRKLPTAKPSKRPTLEPTRKPSKRPTIKPSKRPTKRPTFKPTRRIGHRQFAHY